MMDKSMEDRLKNYSTAVGILLVSLVVSILALSLTLFITSVNRNYYWKSRIRDDKIQMTIIWEAKKEIVYPNSLAGWSKERRHDILVHESQLRSGKYLD